MIIIGEKLIPFSDLYNINNINDIQKTPSNSMVSFGYNEDILKYCYENSIKSAVKISSIKEAIFANALNSSYILVEISQAKKIQALAENYMFDSKILAIIESQEEIEKIATEYIDGVIYKSLLY